MAKLQSFFAICVLYTISVVSCEEFCSVNTFNTSDNYMQFTKEANFEEYVVSGKFKDLHCCAKGYRSIIWLKDGKPYPWGLQESSFILFPESANQTIYAKGAKPEDAGNYTCVLKNETVVHKHTIQLTVFEKVPDDAKLTYISRNADVAIGDSLRLFCEAFIGQFDLPDARSEAYWLKVTPNNTFDQLLPHVHEEKIKREDNQTFGVYLVVPNVKKEDFGDYVCIISKPGNVKEHYVSIGERGERQFEDANKEAPFGIVILIVSVVFFVIVAVVVLFLKFGLQFLVYLKDSWFPSERLDENDKTFDALVLYGEQDSELALGVLRPTLENYKYSCLTKPLPETLGTWYSSLRNDSQNCHRIIAVLSPSVLNGTWESNSILQAISQLQCLGPKLICVILKELPKNQNDIKNAQGETLSKVANSVPILEWKRKSDEKFWYALRWRLPPKRDEEDARLNNMA